MNQTNKKIPFQQRLNESFQKHSQHVAIERGDSHITYSQLESKADCICKWITNEGIQPESFIGICLDDTINIIPIMIGILKARCVFTILDTSLPRQRLLNMIRLTHLQIIFTSVQNKKMLFDDADEPNHSDIEKPARIIIEDEIPLLPSSSSKPGDRQYDREDKIYIYFTSGTTGMPRGFVGKNKSLLHFIDWEIETFDIDKTFRFSQWVTPGFDAFLRDVFTPLCAGGVICIPPHKVLELVGQELIHWLNARHINLIHCVPSIFRLLNTFTEKSAAKENLKALKMIVMAGEKIIPHELSRWFEMFDERIQLINLYGTSETTMAKTCHFITPADAGRPIVPVGKPIPGARILILDENLQLCPKKFVGEIYIRTPFRTHGYYNDPQANKERFIPNPFSNDADDWLHKTGDQGRLLNDDNIEVLGRVDRQVKIRGVRVEPEEIENMLLQHPAVAEVAVVDKENNADETYLCAYFVPRQTHPDVATMEDNKKNNVVSMELEKYLTANLPSYMVPTFFISLEKMPLTSNGKINYRALPEPHLGKDDHYIPPENGMEEKLVTIWSEILNVDKNKISMNTNFFRIGGHSLNATIIMSRIHRQLAIKIPLAEIFKNPTVRGLSNYMNTAALAENRLSSIEPVEVREYYPLSSAQKRIYFLQQLDSQGIAYNMPMVQPIGNSINAQELESILNKLIARHETLRTSFIQVGDQPFQKVHDRVSFASEYYDLATEDTEDTERRIQHLIHSFVRPFDLSRAPLLRSGLIRMVNGYYIWLVDIHHIVTDGTSQNILMKDFSVFAQGKELAPLSLHYKDFSQWQNQLLENGVIHVQQNYWLSQLSDEIPRLDLPTDYKRPGRFTFAGDNYSFILDKEDVLGFRELGNKIGATLYMNILTVLNILFYKYTGQTDIIIGSGIAGRLHEDLQDIVGMFVNSLPMRNHPAGEKTYEYFLKEVTANSIKSFENQDVQFEDLVEKLNIQRDFSRNPLFDVLMVVQNFWETREINESLEGGKTGENPPQPRYKRPTAKFDLTFFVNEMEDNIHIIIEYYTGVFKEETIQRLAAHFKAIVKQIVKIPSITINDIDILSEGEKRQIIQKFNDTEREYPIDKTIHQLFAEQAEQTADRIALVGAGEREEKKRRRGEEKNNGVETLRATSLQIQMTYRQLNEKSNQLAGLLIEKGILPDTIIGIMMERSVDMIIGILGILKSGGAYLPIEPNYPKERINYMLKDSRTKFLVTTNNKEDENVKKWEGEKNLEIIFLDSFSLSSFRTSYRPNFLTSHPYNLAYIIYTSGSTGKPKGVLTAHINVTRVVKYTNYVDIKNEDRLLQLSNYAFDGSVFDIYGALLNGAKLVMISKNDVLEIGRLAEIIRRERITVFFITTALFNTLVEMEIGCFDRVRKILLGGERASVEHSGKALGYLGKGRIINAYGPTESTVFATYYNIDSIGAASENIPIGKPVSNTTIYILDKHLKLVSIGVTGEVYIGGTGVARGYLNNPELTDERFKRNVISHSSLAIGKFQRDDNSLNLPNDQCPMSNVLFYKTGDWARWLPDGNIEFLGRIDQQVKLRGFRIELGEIENRLLNYPGIKEAVVLAQKEDGSDKFLCAYIVSPKKYDEIAIREFLSEKLPDHMIPSYLVRLDKIPLTANGKINRKALPKPEFESGDRYIAPRNEIDKKLVGLWSEVLGIASIGIDDNFFELGGHSLKATALISRIHKELDIKIPLAEFFKTPTIQGLSDYISGTVKNIYESILPVEEKEYYSLSFAQERMYILQQMDLNSTAYNMPQVIPLTGGIDTGRLEEAFRKLIRRHDSLRTSFHMSGDRPVQRIHKQVNFEIDRLQDQYLSVRPFDLSHAPLLRVGLLNVEKEQYQQYILIVDMHHIISDGVSHQVLKEDFMAFYQGNELPSLRIQYKDFAQWQNSPKEVERLHQQMSYWLKELAGEIPVLEIPLDYPRPMIQSFEGSSIDFQISEEETRGLNALALNCGGTLFMVLTTAVNILLAKLSSLEEIIIGTPIAGRRHPDLEKIIGMFVNTLALRNYPNGEQTFIEFLGDVKERLLTVFENQEYPFEVLVDKLSLKRDMGRNPLFDVMFALQNINTVSVEPNDGDGQRLNQPAVQVENKNIGQTAKFDLTFIAVEIGQKILFTIQYCTKLFKQETIERFSRYIKKIVSQVIENPELKLKEIEIIPDDERRRLLIEFNNAENVYPNNKTIQQLFEEQVEQTPDYIALVGALVGAGEGEEKKRRRGEEKNSGVETLRATSLQYQHQITYHQLNEQSDQLAGLLIEKGVLADHIVGIMVERSFEMIIGLLGILKSGAAYLPLNPKNPSSRNQYMLKDSGTKLLAVANGLDGETVRKWEGEKIFLESVIQESNHLKGRPRRGLQHSNHLAYLIYTSGSTGNPKGVPITHANFSSLVHWGYRNMGLSGTDRFLQNLSYFFDWSAWEIFLALTTGAGLYLTHEDVLLDGQALGKFINEKRITVLHITPSQFQALVETAELKNLKHLCLGAEKLTYDLVQRSMGIIPDDCRLYNMYGPTEATIIASVLEIKRNSINKYENLSSVPIGVPVGNAQLYILDKYSNLCPVKVTGELYIGGSGVSRGYLNNPELTCEKFNRSYRTNRTYIFYKTGDLARWLADGVIEFMGRIDYQIKIRGYRIELGEIENKLLEHKGVKSAAVIVRGETNLCAYVVPECQGVNEIEFRKELKAYLNERLVGYMIPSFIVFLEHMPLTPNGKVDLDALRAFRQHETISMEEYIAPRDEIEEKLAAIWSEILGIDKSLIGMQANFFELGGHSLKATVLASKVHKELNVIFPLSEIFKAPTIREMGEYITNAKNKVKKDIDRNLVLIKEGLPGDGHFFFIHDGSGEIEGYIEFCKHLSNYNFWGIKAGIMRDNNDNSNDNPWEIREITIEELASSYIEKIKKIQPNGPYCIAGWSLGGVIAFEITLQLEKLGEKVSFLGLIDASGPQRERQNYEIKEELENVPDIMSLLEEKNVSVEIIKKWIPAQLTKLIPNYDQLDLRQIIYSLNTIRTLANANVNYIPTEKITSALYYFKAGQSPLEFQESWKNYCNIPIKSYEIACDHFSILKNPAAIQTGKFFADALRTL